MPGENGWRAARRHLPRRGVIEFVLARGDSAIAESNDAGLIGGEGR